MKYLLLVLTLFSSSSIIAKQTTLLVGTEFNMVFKGHHLVERNDDIGIKSNVYLNELISLGPNIEMILTPKFSLRLNTQINYNQYGAKGHNTTFTRFAVPIDLQGFYSLSPEFKVGTGLNFIFTNSIKESIYNDDSSKTVNHYTFKNAIAPIFTLMITDPFYNNEQDKQNTFRYFALSYSKHSLSLDNYQPNDLLDESEIDGGRLSFTIGLFGKVLPKSR